MPDHASLDLARRRLESGRPAEAEQLLLPITRTNPDNAGAWHLLAAAQGQLGRHDDAAHSARRTMSLRPDFAGGYVNLALALRAAARPAEACETLRDAASRFPNDKTLQSLLASALEETGRIKEAIAQYRIVCAMNPGDAAAPCALGNLLLRDHAYEDATAVFRSAVRTDSQSIAALMGQAYCLRMTGHYAEAANVYRDAVRKQPDDPAARAGLAAALERAGEFDSALHELEPLLGKANPDLHALIVYARLSGRYGRERDAAKLLQDACSRPETAGEMAVQARFAQGEILDSLGEYDAAFESFRAGNQLKQASFNPAIHRAAVDRVIRAYSADFLARAPRSTNTSDAPVFIVGMPRSGTTLVEQILASHPGVATAGEVQEMPRIVRDIDVSSSGPAGRYPECIVDVSVAALDRLAERYLLSLGAGSPHTGLITDKLPGNWWNLGLIELLLPRARVIHVLRDPRDTCLSCYFQNFAVGHEYAFDLRHLGSVYLDYERLWRHWSQALRIPLLALSYEELVAHPEDAIGAILAFCRLPWDERCLRPHETVRQIATASYDQVRRPVHQRSAGRWRNYERHLQPLFEELARGRDPHD